MGSQLRSDGHKQSGCTLPVKPLLVIAAVFSATMSAHAQSLSCASSLSRLIEAEGGAGEVELAIAQRTQELAQELEAAHAVGPVDSVVIEKMADPDSPQNRAFLEKIFGSLCLARQSGVSAALLRLSRDSRAGMARSFALLAGSLGVGQAFDPERPFPYALVAASAIVIPLYSELSCRNGANALETTSDSRLRKWLRAYRGYALLAVPANLLYTGLTYTEDKARGRDIDPTKYLEVGATSIVWDLGMGAINVSLLDPIYRAFPKVSERLANTLENKVLIGRLRPISELKLLGKRASELPGWASEMLTRVAVGSTRSMLFLELQNKVVNAQLAKRFFQLTGIPVVPKSDP